MKNFVEASTFCHLVTDGTHNSPKKTNDGVLLVTSKNITNGKLDLSKSYYISKDDAIEINKRSKVNKFDILISMIGTVGEVCFIDQEPNFVVKNVGILKNKDKFHAKWLYFYLKSQEAQNIIKERLNGTTQQYLSLGELRKLPILKPISENHLINTVEILDNFEKKITLNTQTNQTLEQIAQAIFKHWFIDFAPVHAKANALARGETTEQAELAAMACLSGKTTEKITALKAQDPTAYQQLQQTAAAFPSEFVETEMGEVPKGWERTTLTHICEMKNGYAFKSKEWTDEGIPVIKIGSVKPMLIELDNGSFVAAENETLRADFLASEGDILVGLTGYVGEVGRIPYQEKAMINQRVAKFMPKKITETMNYYCFIYYLARQKEFKAFTEMNAKGSAQANISTKEILSYPVIIATKEIHIAFENTVKNLLDKIIVNSGENSTLAKTRDELLPRLLSGEIEL